MTRTYRSSLVAALTMLACAPVAQAQSPAPPPPPANTQSAAFTASEDQRPTTTTFLGDTGIWYVPTAEILRSGTWSVGGDRRGTNYVLSRGISASRLRTATYGEEDPEHANAHEDTAAAQSPCRARRQPTAMNVYAGRPLTGRRRGV